MRDRIPAPGRENRIRITQDDGTVIAGKLEYDDQATQEGSAYTKGNVLPDDVCDLMELDYTTSEPDDAFRYLALMQSAVYGAIVFDIKTNGTPVANFSFFVDENQVTTNENGRAIIELPPGDYTASFEGALDISFSQQSVSVTSDKGKVNYYSIEAETNPNNESTFTASGNFSFSSMVKSFDVFCVGGGGSGGAAAGFGDSTSFQGACATGGGGGYTKTETNITETSGVFQVVIGSGGKNVSAQIRNSSDPESSGAYKNGLDGGETYVMNNDKKICSALGGKGGKADFQAINGSASGADGGSGSGVASYGWGVEDVADSGENGEDGGTLDYVTFDDVPGDGQGYTTRAFGENDGDVYSPAGGGALVYFRGWASNPHGEVHTGLPGSHGGSPNALAVSSTSATVTANSGTVAGAGGGAAAIGPNKDVGSANYTATSGAGKSGLVIIRWRYE